MVDGCSGLVFIDLYDQTCFRGKGAIHPTVDRLETFPLKANLCYVGCAVMDARCCVIIDMVRFIFMVVFIFYFNESLYLTHVFIRIALGESKTQMMKKKTFPLKADPKRAVI